MTRFKTLHDRISGNLLCELILIESEVHELLAAYEARRRTPPYPPMSLQIFAHNAKEHASVAVYLAHAPDILDFAHHGSLQWLEQKIVDAYRARRDGVKAEIVRALQNWAETNETGQNDETKEATPGC